MIIIISASSQTTKTSKYHKDCTKESPTKQPEISSSDRKKILENVIKRNGDKSLNKTIEKPKEEPATENKIKISKVTAPHNPTNSNKINRMESSLSDVSRRSSLSYTSRVSSSQLSEFNKPEQDIQRSTTNSNNNYCEVERSTGHTTYYKMENTSIKSNAQDISTYNNNYTKRDYDKFMEQKTPSEYHEERSKFTPEYYEEEPRIRDNYVNNTTKYNDSKFTTEYYKEAPRDTMVPYEETHNNYINGSQNRHYVTSQPYHQIARTPYEEAMRNTIVYYEERPILRNTPSNESNRFKKSNIKSVNEKLLLEDSYVSSPVSNNNKSISVASKNTLINTNLEKISRCNDNNIGKLIKTPTVMSGSDSTMKYSSNIQRLADSHTTTYHPLEIDEFEKSTSKNTLWEALKEENRITHSTYNTDNEISRSRKPIFGANSKIIIAENKLIDTQAYRLEQIAASQISKTINKMEKVVIEETSKFEEKFKEKVLGKIGEFFEAVNESTDKLRLDESHVTHSSKSQTESKNYGIISVMGNSISIHNINFLYKKDNILNIETDHKIEIDIGSIFLFINFADNRLCMKFYLNKSSNESINMIVNFVNNRHKDLDRNIENIKKFEHEHPRSNKPTKICRYSKDSYDEAHDVLNCVLGSYNNLGRTTILQIGSNVYYWDNGGRKPNYTDITVRKLDNNVYIIQDNKKSNKLIEIVNIYKLEESPFDDGTLDNKILKDSNNTISVVTVLNKSW